MNKWDWVGASLICVGFAVMILSVTVLYSSLSFYTLLSGLAILIGGFAVGVFLSDWDPMFWGP